MQTTFSAAALAIVVVTGVGCGNTPDAANQSVTLNDQATSILTGSFVAKDHETSGGLRIELDATANRVIFLEDFQTDNGPALVVGLSAQTIDGMTNDNAWPANTVKLGALAGITGEQEYAIPAGTDVATFKSVVVWCEEFTVAFGAAGFTQ
jgi:Electron transfer DM13